MKTSESNSIAGFTRIELLAVLIAVAVLTTLALPVLAASTGNSQRAQCFNNLRQIGHAVRQWGGDHFEEPPWLTLTSDGGTRPTSGMKAGAAWFEYLSLSNELVTPRILACPSDANVKIASHWGTGANGLPNSALRSQAISYLLGLHANSIRPMALVAADFNIWLSAGPFNCGPASVNNANGILTQPSPPPESVKWTNGPHLSAGHILVADGSAMFLNSDGLTRTVSERNSTDTGVHHILRAR